MEAKLGISLSRQYKVPITEALPLIRQVGFSAVSPLWGTKVNMEEICLTAKQCGLALQSLHAPFGGTDTLWSSDPAVFGKSLGFVMQALDDCIRFGIPVMVMHAWIDNGLCYDMQNLYFGNFDAVVKKASDHGVQIAFENTEGEKFLFALLAHYKDNLSVGFCWDSGHEKCYNHDQDLLSIYGDRLLMVHLNDNLGISDPGGSITYLDDLHLVPYDGCMDWPRTMQRLSKCRPIPYLNFELSLVSKPGRNENEVYAQMPLADFYALAYERGRKLLL